MQSKAAILIRVLSMALLLALAASLPARADSPRPGALVRLQAWSIEVGWHEGQVQRADNGCTVVELHASGTEAQYRIALADIDWLEVRRGDSWSAVSVGRLLESEPAVCGGRLAAGG
jgi:hypothetical protein